MPYARSRADATWEGNLMEGWGTVSMESGVLQGQPISWASRTNRVQGKTSPEELIAAAHAGCFAMAFSNTLAQAGHQPSRLEITAICTFETGDAGARISTMELEVCGVVPGIDQSQFEEFARQGERGCPVSNALRNNVDIKVKAELQR